MTRATLPHSRHLLRAFVLVGLVAAVPPLRAQWGPVTTAAAPTPRADALLAFDLIGQRTLLFGGNGTNELWSLANGTWTQGTPPVLPGARMRAQMTASPFTGEILLYGGIGNGQFALDETWQWNGTTWQQLAPLVTPGGFARHGLAFDTARQVFVLFGGRNNLWIPNQCSSQTWEFANGN